MPYPASPEDLAAIERLGSGYFNNDPVSPTNPGGFDNGGYVTNLHAANDDTARAASFVGDAAAFVGTRADEVDEAVVEAAGYVGKMSGTSTSSVEIGEGLKTFQTQAAKFFEPGRWVDIVSAADAGNAMIGMVVAYVGTALTVSVTRTRGAGSFSDWRIFASGQPGANGDEGEPGPQGGSGRMAGLPLVWSTSNGESDPGTAKLKINNATSAAATRIYISETDLDGKGITSLVRAACESTSEIRGRIDIFDAADPANFMSFDVTGDLDDRGGWDALTVTHRDHGGTLVNGATVLVHPVSNGSKGSPGDPGEPGLQGAPGPVGNPPAILFNFDVGTTDADPGNGKVRFNNTVYANATAIFFDNLDAFSSIVANWLDGLDDSTNIGHKGELTFVQVDDAARFAKFRVTGSVIDAGGYRRVPVQHVESSGTLQGRVGVGFARTGNAGASGEGVGDVTGPDEAVIGSYAVFLSEDGKVIGQGPTQFDGNYQSLSNKPAIPDSPDDIGAAAAADLTAFLARRDNPNEVTKAQVGLGNVANVAPADMPVSVAQADALALKAALSSPAFVNTPTAPTAAAGTNTQQLATLAFVIAEILARRGAPNGIASLGADTKILSSQLPALAITDTFEVASQAAMLALTAERGDVAVRSDINKSFILKAEPATTLANWVELKTPTDVVLAVAGLTGTITASDLRTALSLVVGTNVQAYDADLNAIAALTTSIFGRNLLTLADGSALLGAAGGLAASAVATVAEVRAGTATGKYVSPASLMQAQEFVTFDPAAIDLATFINGKVTLAAASTFATPTGAKAGASGTLRIVSGGFQGSWSTFWNFGPLGPPALTAGVNRVYYQVDDGATSADCTFKAGA